MNLHFRAAARSDLDAIYDYGLAAHGAEAAEAYLRLIDAAMERLLAYPELGAARDIRAGIRALPVRDHLIFYLREPDTIVIVRVLHKSADVGQHLSN